MAATSIQQGDINTTEAPPTPPKSLHPFFEAQPLSEHAKQWDGLWERGDFLPWDRGQPSPALYDVLKNRQDLVGGPLDEQGKRRTALVPGAGRGYDVLLLAALGFEVYGLDISDHGLEAAESLKQTQFEQYQKQYQLDCGSGKPTLIKGDFFKDDWLADIKTPDSTFDIVYDYTFLCALPPDARPAWAKRMTQLLSKRSHSCLICLEFPMFKDPKVGGPPHGLNADVYVQHLGQPGVDIPYNEAGYPEKSQPSDDKQSSRLTRLARWQPDRTHEAGQGSDFISIWKHA